MPKITYINESGSHDVEVDVGSSVMEGAVSNGIDGIVAECGGSCSCATCHVYVDSQWLSTVGKPNELEEEMLECTESERLANSRLSCQIRVTEDMDGLIVKTPPAQ